MWWKTRAVLEFGWHSTQSKHISSYMCPNVDQTVGCTDMSSRSKLCVEPTSGLASNFAAFEERIRSPEAVSLCCAQDGFSASPFCRSRCRRLAILMRNIRLPVGVRMDLSSYVRPKCSDNSSSICCKEWVFPSPSTFSLPRRVHLETPLLGIRAQDARGRISGHRQTERRKVQGSHAA